MPRGRGCFGFRARLRRALLSGYAVCTAAVSAWFDAVGHLCGYALIFSSAVLPVLAGIFSSASICELADFAVYQVGYAMASMPLFLTMVSSFNAAPPGFLTPRSQAET